MGQVGCGSMAQEVQAGGGHSSQCFFRQMLAPLVLPYGCLLRSGPLLRVLVVISCPWC